MLIKRLIKWNGLGALKLKQKNHVFSLYVLNGKIPIKVKTSLY